MSNAAMPVAPPDEVVFGIGKKLHLELAKHPLHTHAAIMNMLRTMLDHRKVELDNAAQAEQVKLQNEAMAEARKAHAEAQVRRESSIVATIRGAGSPLPVPGHVPEKPRYEPSTEGEPNEQTLEQRANAAGLVLA